MGLEVKVIQVFIVFGITVRTKVIVESIEDWFGDVVFMAEN